MGYWKALGMCPGKDTQLGPSEELQGGTGKKFKVQAAIPHSFTLLRPCDFLSTLLGSILLFHYSSVCMRLKLGTPVLRLHAHHYELHFWCLSSSVQILDWDYQIDFSSQALAVLWVRSINCNFLEKTHCRGAVWVMCVWETEESNLKRACTIKRAV